MLSESRTPSLTPSRSPSPELPVQPDHFYGYTDVPLPPSPDSDGKGSLDPEDDPNALRGIPVFKPSMDEFRDFEAYITKIECWGKRSGIVKVIPPKEWTAALPSLKEQLKEVKIKSPIEQHMLGRGGLFRQENMEKRKVMSVREWAELCGKDDFRAPGINEVGLHARSANVKPRAKKVKKKATKAETVGPELDTVIIKEEPVDDLGSLTPMVHGDAGSNHNPIVLSPPNSVVTPVSPIDGGSDKTGTPAGAEEIVDEKPKVRGRRIAQTKEVREANLAERAVRDSEFLETFNPHAAWLPPNTKPSDYTPDFCQKLERQYWRNCGLGKPAWYGADSQGSLYTDETTSWNVAHLPSTLSRILPSSDQGLPGVNTPYLYFGMWRATFAWHVEDMDLFSINYIHFGAPKFWYAIPQSRAAGMEGTMRGYFPKDTSNCPQFLRHKSFLASPTLLAQSACRPNHLVQHSGEFVITFPRGYHAGFNLGFNCAESVNFALDSWLELGRNAKACECISDSVRIDVDQLLMDRAMEAANPPKPQKQKRSASKKENENKDTKSKLPRKRKSEVTEDAPKAKKLKIKVSPPKGAPSSSHAQNPAKPQPKLSITLKLGPRPTEPEFYPCCLCISTNREGLLRVYDPPVGRKDAEEATGNPKEWCAHEYCASVVPETWVDEIEIGNSGFKEKVVFGVDGIVKDRWHLKCSACTKSRPKAHGAPIQCTKGKCPKAFHVSCAKDGTDIVFTVLKEVEKEVVLLDTAINAPTPGPSQMQVDHVVQPRDPNAMNVDPSATPPSRVLKVIRKLEVQVLCVQHNPAIAAAKRANKQDKIRADLLALPSMARIKIRVSAGVFEVSLIRVIEETNSVEVLWDRGIKKEFKWGSIVFGNTDGPVHQYPSELAPEPQLPTYSSVMAATANHSSPQVQPPQTSTVTQPYGKPYPYPPRSGPYDYWAYQQPTQYGSTSQPAYGYHQGYYQAPQTVPGQAPQYNMYAYTPGQYAAGQLNWQQPYQVQPVAGASTGYYRMAQSSILSGRQSQAPQLPTSTTLKAPAPDPTFQGTSPLQPAIPSHVSPTPIPIPMSAQAAVVATTTTDEQGVFRELAALSSLQPSQITELLQANPQLRDVVMAAIAEAKRALPAS
ncbi:JmjC domain, hydroxylase-domain-containing protein [Collybia nuda]|uniref:[histone H3]-trimethyl-L-lysine(9) demethylase n=1 Tax=Collybia nuda TaxID=64659 RepID=A0A9P5YF46_9AGAR|nr:JmjC domain, hydroxylase-domain-containing protein [Collybia nuda]